MSFNGNFNFGGTGGSFYNIGDIGSKIITFHYGAVINNIQISEDDGTIIGDYGYEWDSASTSSKSATIPSDGIIHINSLYTNEIGGNVVISYINAIIGNSSIQVGSINNPSAELQQRSGMYVTLTGIASGAYVDSLTFCLAQSS